MSKAKACDRCGRIYSVDFKKNKDGKFSYKDYPVKVQYGCDYGKYTDYISVDLCHECSSEFEKFVHNSQD